MLKKLLDQMVKDITTSPTIPLEYKAGFWKETYGI